MANDLLLPIGETERQPAPCRARAPRGRADQVSGFKGSVLSVLSAERRQ